jgi:hypothetical protein
MYPNAKLAVASMEDVSRFDSGCRLVGPITASGNRTVPQFVYDSFNEELKFANLYSTDQGASQLKLTLLAVTFSSVSVVTGGWWEFTVKLDNPTNGRSLTTTSK